jgi:hypothetical protein
MSAIIIAQKVRLPNNCKCGSELATIGPGDGKHPATLACVQCGSSRGAISSFTLQWIESVAMFGSPATIVLRRVIKPVEVQNREVLAASPARSINRRSR